MRKSFGKKKVQKNPPKKENWTEFQHFETRKKVFLQAVKITTCNRVFLFAKWRMVSPLLQTNLTFFFETRHETSDSFLKLHETGDSFLKLHMKLVTFFWNCMKLVTVFWNCTWFFIYIDFTWNWLTKKKVVMAKSHLKARFHMQTGFIFLFYCHTVSAETVE